MENRRVDDEIVLQSVEGGDIGQEGEEAGGLDEKQMQTHAGDGSEPDMSQRYCT
jgi:hypothetical protein